MFVTCKLSVKVLKNPLKIRPIRSNLVNFFRIVIRSGSGQNDPNPVWFRFGQNFDPFAHCSLALYTLTLSGATTPVVMFMTG